MLESHLERIRVSIPSNGSIQFLSGITCLVALLTCKASQSPLTGQFNFYGYIPPEPQTYLALGSSQSPLTGQFNFYIPSSIISSFVFISKSQSPLTGQFNFYTLAKRVFPVKSHLSSQSPLTGQFNFYRNHPV